MRMASRGLSEKVTFFKYDNRRVTNLEWFKSDSENDATKNYLGPALISKNSRFNGEWHSSHKVHALYGPYRWRGTSSKRVPHRFSNQLCHSRANIFDDFSASIYEIQMQIVEYRSCPYPKFGAFDATRKFCETKKCA